jgi:hypothetical protein
MTELEKLKLAHGRLSALANGIDFNTGQPLDSDTCLNDVRNARLFFYTANVLDAVIRNDGNIGTPEPKSEVIISGEFTSRLSANAYPLSISEFSKRINEVAADFGMKNIPMTVYTNWLVKMRFLDEVTDYQGKKSKVTNDESAKIGIIAEERNSPQYGKYSVNLYTHEAQEFLIQHLPDIVMYHKNK